MSSSSSSSSANARQSYGTVNLSNTMTDPSVLSILSADNAADRESAARTSALLTALRQPSPELLTARAAYLLACARYRAAWARSRKAAKAMHAGGRAEQDAFIRASNAWRATVPAREAAHKRLLECPGWWNVMPPRRVRK